MAGKRKGGLRPLEIRIGIQVILEPILEFISSAATSACLMALILMQIREMTNDASVLMYSGHHGHVWLRRA